MREIIFRGKHEGKWVYGSLLIVKPNEGILEPLHYYICPLEVSDMYRVDPDTVGQYTGLPDKNGVKIFEGDVMVCRQYIGGNFIDYCIERGFVEMLHGAFGLHRKQGYYRPFKDWLEAYEYEIIGNIHDNPEFLKE